MSAFYRSSSVTLFLLAPEFSMANTNVLSTRAACAIDLFTLVCGCVSSISFVAALRWYVHLPLRAFRWSCCSLVCTSLSSCHKSFLLLLYTSSLSAVAAYSCWTPPHCMLASSSLSFVATHSQWTLLVCRSALTVLLTAVAAHSWWTLLVATSLSQPFLNPLHFCCSGQSIGLPPLFQNINCMKDWNGSLVIPLALQIAPRMKVATLQLMPRCMMLGLGRGFFSSS